MPVFKDRLTKVVPYNDTDIWTPSWGIRMAHILKESANRDGGQGQSWCGRWQFRTKTAWWELFLMMILTSELHQVLTHLFHTRAAVDFEQVPACPLPNWAMRHRRRTIKLITRCNAIITMRYQYDEDIRCPVCSHRIRQCNQRFTISYSDIFAITETCWNGLNRTETKIKVN